MKNIKIAYIGGGSKMWAPIFMKDLALTDDLTGEIALYDIDKEAAKRNKIIGNKINLNHLTKSKFVYEVYQNIDDALKEADFVVISILPGTLEEMRVDIHLPEKYGIYQAVGDTVGPGGVIRAMRTVPLYEVFAREIKKCCPNAWVINLTNPMSICLKTLYDVFPQIKAYGCCHEVFHAQDFLTLVAEKTLKIKRPNRKDIYTDASGINHFTWITEAKYKDIDLLSLIPKFEEKYYKEGYYENPLGHRYDFKFDCFAYGNKVKMFLFNQYGCLPAAGDRHLVEFVNNKWFLNNKKQVKSWKYSLTDVNYRLKQYQNREEELIAIANGDKELVLEKSQEECVDMIKALLGYNVLVSNVNLPNSGQVPYLPLGSIVETNCVFTNNLIKPIISKNVPLAVQNLIYRNCMNIETLYDGIKRRDLNTIYICFMNQPLCCNLSFEKGKKLFDEMILGTKKYLEDFYYDI